MPETRAVRALDSPRARAALRRPGFLKTHASFAKIGPREMPFDLFGPVGLVWGDS